ncbi:uncharacterized protein LOC133521848 [Cydia pomonella]|uniref:uncharacterized protein LOC133521848 n=1 Tax=Cydia pomonella TaxID=82600 RepID=UPI002ADDF83A|nr:uncharacterized protein LOC133521848 [Cydia pomonella]
MKVGIILVLVCVAGADSDVVRDFLEVLKVQFENAWIGFKNFIKRPPRSKRIHEHVSRTSSTSTDFWWSSTTSKFLTKKTTYQTKLPQTVRTRSMATATPIIDEIMTIQNTMPPDMLYYFQRPRHKQVLLPFFPSPKWRTRDHWNQMQQSKADFFLWRDEFSGGGGAGRSFALADEDVTTAQQLDQPTDEGIGVMMFI